MGILQSVCNCRPWLAGRTSPVGVVVESPPLCPIMSTEGFLYILERGASRTSFAPHVVIFHQNKEFLATQLVYAKALKGVRSRNCQIFFTVHIQPFDRADFPH